MRQKRRKVIAVGLVCSTLLRLDNLGRIVIPKELRKKYGLTEGADITFEDFGAGILVKACDGLCRLCGAPLGDCESEIPLCEPCIARIVKENKNK